ncbi:HAMP domain-containing sensor histidine kinase [Halobacillus naozhouensis]|uniref:histidine kinase n=1 Tax=Halobacillus naozhouensis TaxID=554880 RepID=A0ABY8IW65_9BACI|nr:HAMP domain-containing sensor histidine kinase [Halobacillus naozhouensis]WFT74445.1 HAMP domain-containing sensor histidine kinase [Halobacillus naozhouensis]
MRKWLKSLQAKYLLLILFAVLMIPICVPIVSMVVYLPGIAIEDPNEPYGDFDSFESRWHKEADALNGATKKQISSQLRELHSEFPAASMFWVNAQGKTVGTVNYEESLPEQWSSAYTVQFMKENYENDPFTVVSFIGETEDQGFMVVQLDRKFIDPPITNLSERYDYIFFLAFGCIMVVFIFLSWVFFKKFHKRLMRLQEAMERKKDESGLPLPITKSGDDEIGQLESSFNRMVHELEESRQREQQEEKIRRELIANLSHDLRTPLTTIRAAMNGINSEVTSEHGKEKLQSVHNKIDYVSNLIDNLLSFTLLSGKKYPYHSEKLEMNRFMRETAAHWYPVLEEKRIEVDLQTAEIPVYWEVDTKWMERILDNLLQNIVRYASQGRYAGIFVTKDTITIQDRGPGMKEQSVQKGAGIGLSIVDLMVREMGLQLRIKSNHEGTRIDLITKDAQV